MPVEQQTQSTSAWAINYHNDGRGGQRLTISNRKVTKLAFLIRHRGSPTGNFTMCIRRESDDGILLSKVWGLANDLPTVADWVEVTFATPTIINEEVRLSAEADVQPYGDDVFYSYQNTDVKPGEVHSRYLAGAWADQGSEDCAYKYTYEAPPGPTVNITNTDVNPTYFAAGGGGRRTIMETELSPTLPAPQVTTDPATGIVPISATLIGTLDDEGLEPCDCGFEWGLDTSYGTITSTEKKGTSETFSQILGGLEPNTTYHFRAFATNVLGTSYG